MEMVADLEMPETREAAVSGLHDFRPRTLSEVHDDHQMSTLHLVRVSTLCDALATRPAADVKNLDDKERQSEAPSCVQGVA